MHVQDVLAVLEQEGLVRQTAETESAYVFKHILTQETVYASMLRQDRRVLHRLIGDICRTLYASHLDDNLLLLADHYAGAGENSQAYDFLMRYGERASRMSAYPEAIMAFERALALVPGDAFAPRARVLVQLGDIYCRRANFEVANVTLETALQEAERASDAEVAATAWSGLARVATQQGEHAKARALGERALAEAEHTNSSEARARAHKQLGISYNFDGDNALAEKHLTAALELYRELGDVEGTGTAMNSLGVVLREENQIDRAWEYFEQALELSRQLGDKYSMGIRLNNLGVIAEQRGDLAAAANYQEQSHTIALEIGDREGAALTELNLASLALTLGESADSLLHLQHCIQALFELRSIPFLLYAIGMFAKWEVTMGNLERGAELLGLAFEHPSSTADIPIDFESVRQEVKAKLKREQLAAAMERGKKLPLAEAVRAILNRKEQG